MSTVIVNKVGVAPRNGNALLIDGGTETHNRARQIIELNDILILGCVYQLRVGLFLLDYGTSTNPLKLAINLDSVHVVLRHRKIIENL